MKTKVPLNLAFLILLFVIFSCKKRDTSQDGFDDTPPSRIILPDSVNSNPVIEAKLKLYDDIISPVVPDDFLGFSYEKSIMTDPDYFNVSNTAFINLHKNLGGGLIRIGGSTVDKTFWSGNKRNSSTKDSVYINDVDRFKEFSQAVGWKTVWGLNLGTAQPLDDAQEAIYVRNRLGGQIHSFAIGNEPEFFNLKAIRSPQYNYNSFSNEFNHFSSVIKDKVPGIIFSGPENEGSEWTTAFLTDHGSKINMFSLHYYRMGPAGNKDITMDKLMTFDKWLVYVINYLRPMVNARGVPFRFTECNSVYRGGQPGISNTFGSSLWGSEFLFYLAQQGIAGVNFHTGGGKLYIYTPIDVVNEKNVARPLYYAMLLFRQAAAKQFLKSELQNTNANINAYNFIRKDGKRGVIIINKDDKNDVSLTINSKIIINSTKIYQLNGPSLTSTTGTNINGSIVSDDGTFKSDAYITNLTTNSKSINIKINSASALLIILN